MQTAKASRKQSSLSGKESAQGCIHKRLLGRPDEALGSRHRSPPAVHCLLTGLRLGTHASRCSGDPWWWARVTTQAPTRTPGLLLCGCGGFLWRQVENGPCRQAPESLWQARSRRDSARKAGEYGLIDTWRRQWHPTPVLLPGKPHGWRSLVGCSPWGHVYSGAMLWSRARPCSPQNLQAGVSPATSSGVNLGSYSGSLVVRSLTLPECFP